MFIVLRKYRFITLLWLYHGSGVVVEWIRRRTLDLKVCGSTPADSADSDTTTTLNKNQDVNDNIVDEKR